MRAVDFADEIAKTADKLGLSTDALQELRFVADLPGVSQQALEMGLQRLGRCLGEIANFGKGEAKTALDELGVSVFDATGRLKTLEEILPEIADALAGVSEQNRRLVAHPEASRLGSGTCRPGEARRSLQERHQIGRG